MYCRWDGGLALSLGASVLGWTVLGIGLRMLPDAPQGQESAAEFASHRQHTPEPAAAAAEPAPSGKERGGGRGTRSAKKKAKGKRRAEKT